MNLETMEVNPKGATSTDVATDVTAQAKKRGKHLCVFICSVKRTVTMQLRASIALPTLTG